MEYEKHVKRLVLGYLKDECKSAYKIFLKNNFPNQHHRIATRVGGQTLEDILNVYSRIQDIVQGHIEDTNYYKENGSDASAPKYLAEQLIYLLDRKDKAKSFTPISTIIDRSPGASTIVDHDDADLNSDRLIDIETTPEHSLPGNLASNENSQGSRTPFQKKSRTPCFKTPYLEKYFGSEQGDISTTISQKLLENSDFHAKLASNINNVRNKPECSSNTRRGDNTQGCSRVIEVEDTVKLALDRTEADPMFEDLIEEFFEPIMENIEKSADLEGGTSSGSDCTSTSKKLSTVERPNPGISTSIPSVFYENKAGSNTQTSTDGNNTEHLSKPLVVEVPSLSQIGAPNCTKSNAETQTFLQTDSTSMCTFGPSIQNRTQPFYIANPPLVIPNSPQVIQLVQPVHTISRPFIVDSKHQTLSRDHGNPTERDIMAMPTIVLNEQNEIAYMDPTNSLGSTPYKTNEVQTIKEYLNAYGLTERSPLIKRKSSHDIHPPLKPAPTIKVEFVNCDRPLKDKEQILSLANKDELPNLNNIEDTAKCTPNHGEIPSAGEIKPMSFGSICTPSPLVQTSRKSTPKSSSHVRNLSFPSPIRKTNEKSDNESNTPSVANKKQATKDLFREEKQEIEIVEVKSSPEKYPAKPLRISPRKHKKVDKSTNKPPKELWDAVLRKNLAPIQEEVHLTPTPKRKQTGRRRSKRSTDLEVSDPDGKRLEEALKTPGKPVKKNKSPNKVKNKSKIKEEAQSSTETKTILSPSKLCNTASKRNMEVDGITPNNSREPINQLVSNARKNINSLLETPLKEEDNVQTVSADTPFTPMLKANLEGITLGDNFSIETPNFPITPGLSLMEHTETYYMMHETESNKATEAVVLSEEKKSSVRKTDDEEDVAEMNPKVYGCRKVLNDFNKSQTGKKNLELLDNRGVTWDGSSDREYKSGREESDSEEERNSTVINAESRVKMSGKSMSMMKRQYLTKESDDANINGALDDSVQEERPQETNKIHDQSIEKDKTVEQQSGSKSHISTNNSKILTDYKKRRRFLHSDGTHEKCHNTEKADIHTKRNTRQNTKTRDSLKATHDGKETSIKEEPSSKNTGNDVARNDMSISSITTDFIKETVKTSHQAESTRHLSTQYTSIQSEILEKRKRMIKLEKLNRLENMKTPSRRGNMKCFPIPSLVNKQNRDAQRKTLRKSPSQVNQVGPNKKSSILEDLGSKYTRTVDVMKETVAILSSTEPSSHEASSHERMCTIVEKRKRMIELEKINQFRNLKSPPNRRKIKKYHPNVMSANKRKRVSPRKILRKSPSQSEQSTINGNEKEVDSQDEFFKKIGSNLHRTNKIDNGKNMEHNEHGKSEDTMERTVESENNQKSCQDGDANMSTDLNHSHWNECSFQLQPEEINILYDPMNKLNNHPQPNSVAIKNRHFQLTLPLDDGSLQVVAMEVTPFQIMWEISGNETTDCSSDSVVDADDLKSSRKRKHRSDSCNSNSSSKRMKTLIIPKLNDNSIEKILNKLHGPSEKT